MNRITLFACESQPIVVEGLLRVLDRAADLELIGQASTLPETLEIVRGLRPQVMLVDQSVGLKMVFQFLSDLRSVCPETFPVLWVHEMAEIDCFRALQVGARGILRKSMPVANVLECLRAVAQGRIWIENGMSGNVAGYLQRKHAPRLTPREREIVKHVCAGMKNKQIAEELKITPGTVKVHLMHIFEKTGVKDRFELAVHGRRLAGEQAEEEPDRARAQRAAGF